MEYLFGPPLPEHNEYQAGWFQTEDAEETSVHILDAILDSEGVTLGASTIAYALGTLPGPVVRA